MILMVRRQRSHRGRRRSSRRIFAATNSQFAERISKQVRATEYDGAVPSACGQRSASLRLNFYKKAKLANSFKWRLIENGVAREIADEVTQSLMLYLSQIGFPRLRVRLPASGARPYPAKDSDSAGLSPCQ